MIAVQQKSTLRLLVILPFTIALASCGWTGAEHPEAHLVPDEPGLYAVEGNKLGMRLDGDREWEIETWSERSSLGNNVEFIIYHPSVSNIAGQPNAAISLQRVAWVRSDISNGGEILPSDGSRWQVSDNPEFAVPATVSYVADRSDVLRTKPNGTLENGLYALRVELPGSEITSRFGVHWPSVDKRRYAGSNCVDRYDSDGRTGYRPCYDQAQTLAAKGLQLHLVKPETTQVGDTPGLVVFGVIVNVGKKPKPLPMLEARLRSADGQILKRWQFNAEATELKAGASTPFRTVVRDLPKGLADVEVAFLPVQSAAREGG